MPTVPDSLANTTRAAHDVGLAAWVGGTLFAKFALNPSVKLISSHTERGQVTNAAWNGYNPVNALGLGAAAVGWTAARFSETDSSLLTDTEKKLSVAKDVLMGVAVVTGIVNGIQGARLAKQAPEGAVPIESGTEPAAETPPQAAKIQRTLGWLGNLNIVTGVALVATNGVLAQINHSHPSKKRALRSSEPGDAGVSPLWLGSAASVVAAAADQIRRAA
jgi:uncharacterized membrane protein